MWTWVVSEGVAEGGALFLREQLADILGNIHGEFSPFALFSKATVGFWVAVGIRNIRFYVVYRSAVHEVSPADYYHPFTDADDTDRRQSETVGAEGASCGEHP